jgi:hypothetical protein
MRKQHAKIFDCMSHRIDKSPHIHLGPRARLCLKRHSHSIKHTVPMVCLGPVDPFTRTAANNTAEVDKWAAQIVQSVDTIQSSHAVGKSSSTTIMMGKLLPGSFRYLPLYMHILTHTSRCEHYSVQFGGTWDHLFSYEVSTGLYDIEYLEVLFDNNMEEITQIENDACNNGFGPPGIVFYHMESQCHCRELISAYFFFNIIKTNSCSM